MTQNRILKVRILSPDWTKDDHIRSTNNYYATGYDSGGVCLMAAPFFVEVTGRFVGLFKYKTDTF
jgi:hypothetical protein